VTPPPAGPEGARREAARVTLIPLGASALFRTNTRLDTYGASYFCDQYDAIRPAGCGLMRRAIVKGLTAAVGVQMNGINLNSSPAAGAVH